MQKWYMNLVLVLTFRICVSQKCFVTVLVILILAKHITMPTRLPAKHILVEHSQRHMITHFRIGWLSFFCDSKRRTGPKSIVTTRNIRGVKGRGRKCWICLQGSYRGDVLSKLVKGEIVFFFFFKNKPYLQLFSPDFYLASITTWIDFAALSST